MLAAEMALGSAVRLLPPRRRPAVIYSSMRSGSTLLKALLGTNPEVSHVPEVHYMDWPRQRSAFYLRLWWLAREPVVVLKRPCFYSDVDRYPVIPPLPSLPIVLIRNPVDTVLSLERRVSGDDSVRRAFESYGRGLVGYWAETYRNLHERLAGTGPLPHVVFYERLLDDPVRVTEGLFRYLGVSDTHGVREYRPYGSWKWGKDDAGDKIRDLTVQASPPKRGGDAERWRREVARSGPAVEVMQLYRDAEDRSYYDYLTESGYVDDAR